jgi:hypothetical protein
MGDIIASSFWPSNNGNGYLLLHHRWQEPARMVDIGLRSIVERHSFNILFSIKEWNLVSS